MAFTSRVPARIVVTVLVIGLLIPSHAGQGSSTSEPRFHDEPETAQSVPGLAEQDAEMLLRPGSLAEAPVSLLADVAVDEDFVERVGNGWRTAVEDTVAGANALLEPIGLRVEIYTLKHWRSSDAEDSVAAHLKSAEEQIRGTPGRLFLAITGQDTVKYDGWAVASGGRVIVQFYHHRRKKNSALIAHEIGHILGATHHEDEEKCTGEGCIMDRQGYAHATNWCDHHRQLISGFIASRTIGR